MTKVSFSLFFMDLYFYHNVLKLLVGYHCYPILMADF